MGLRISNFISGINRAKAQTKKADLSLGPDVIT